MSKLTDHPLFKALCDPDGRPHGSGKSKAAAFKRERIFDRTLKERMEAIGLPDFETRTQVEERQAAMLRNAYRAKKTCDIDALYGCSITSCGLSGQCVEGCHFATLKRRIWTIESALPILAVHAGPLFAVTIVHPKWEAEVGKMSDLSIRAVRQWNYRRLKSMEVPNLLAVGGFEASLNVEQDGTEHWAGEIQQIVAGATKAQLRSAFRVEQPYRDLRPHQKIVDIRTFKSLPLKLAYGQKRLAQQRLAYESETNGRQNRNDGVPPPVARWAEWDAWLLSLPLCTRIITFGCSRRGPTIF